MYLTKGKGQGMLGRRPFELLTENNLGPHHIAEFSEHKLYNKKHNLVQENPSWVWFLG